MNIFKKIQANKATIKFYREYDKLEVQGKLEHFDQADLSFLDGKYWQGLPMYYFLTDYMSNGRCYDASIALGLAMGEGAYIVRGNLKSMIGAWGENRLGHGWVEYGDKVYDTTWKIICDRENYYKVFKPKVWSKIDYKTYKRDLKAITDPEIRTKEWYEKNPTSANLLIFQVREIEMLKLKSANTSEEEKEFARKVLQDLPSVGLRELNEHIDNELKEKELPNEFEL